MTEYIKTILAAGYHAEGYGYKFVGKEYTHWITLFEATKQLQMYCYFTTDGDFNNRYDTGMISPDANELTVLINVLKRAND